MTAEAERLFPKAYDALLNQLITTLKGRLPPSAIEDVLREVGRSLAERHASDGASTDLESRLQNAAEVLKALGGTPSVERDGDKLIIRSGGCPLAAAVVEHPEVCELAEALVAELVGLPVRESCQRGEETPKCRFEIGESE